MRQKADAGQAFTVAQQHRRDAERLRRDVAELRAQVEEHQRVAARADSERATLAAALDGLLRERAIILASTSWRITAPLRAIGARLQHKGFRAARLALRGLLQASGRPGRGAEGRGASPGREPLGPACPAAPVQAGLHRLAVLTEPGAPRRVTLLTDRLSEPLRCPSTRGALLAACALARETASALRIVTHAEAASEAAIGASLADAAIAWDGEIDCLFAPGFDPWHRIAASRDDLFIATSPAIAAAARHSIAAHRVLLHETQI